MSQSNMGIQIMQGQMDQMGMPGNNNNQTMG